MKKIILITGAAGMIGSNLVKKYINTVSSASKGCVTD